MLSLLLLLELVLQLLVLLDLLLELLLELLLVLELLVPRWLWLVPRWWRERWQRQHLWLLRPCIVALGRGELAWGEWCWRQ